MTGILQPVRLQSKLAFSIENAGMVLLTGPHDNFRSKGSINDLSGAIRH